jgi:heme/copper-type cytochrome/quinol oxidase subunit 4
MFMFTFMTMTMHLFMFMFMDTDRDTELLICFLMFTNRMPVCPNDDKKSSLASLVYC